MSKAGIILCIIGLLMMAIVGVLDLVIGPDKIGHNNFYFLLYGGVGLPLLLGFAFLGAGLGLKEKK